DHRAHRGPPPRASPEWYVSPRIRMDATPARADGGREPSDGRPGDGGPVLGGVRVDTGLQQATDPPPDGLHLAGGQQLAQAAAEPAALKVALQPMQDVDRLAGQLF